VTPDLSNELLLPLGLEEFAQRASPNDTVCQLHSLGLTKDTAVLGQIEIGQAAHLNQRLNHVRLSL
jgi:hypothetical protein